LNKGTVPILARLRSLQADVTVLSGGSRVIARPTDRNPVAQLLRTANETMLGRSLEFRSSSGASLTLDVAGRRMLRVTASHGLPGAETCLGAEVLEDEHKDDLIKLMHAVAAPREELRVISGPIGRGGAEVSVGLPVALLADLLLVDLNDVDPDADEVSLDTVPDEAEVSAAVQMTGTSLSEFSGRIGPSLIAFLIHGGDEGEQSSGPEEMVSHLQGFLEDERVSVLQQLDLLAEQPGDPVCLILGSTLIEGHSIVCARLRDSLLLGVIEGDATQVALAAWRGAAP
jgi:hypothetical protein